VITVRDLEKAYEGPNGRTVRALDHVDLAVERGEFHVLLGPSGSGKTTTLRAIAGLDHADSGRITIGGQDVFDSASGLRVPPEQRPIAMVFQSYALWPHMDVYENIAFPLRAGLRRVPAATAKVRVQRAAEMLQLTPYLKRSVGQLSGGQQQRVALARAIALEPDVLLMDEPLSNLDARLRSRLRVELKELTRSLGITTVYVTHDQTEAMVMGDRIAVMQSGRILQQGTPSELYERPRRQFVAQFLGEMNFLSGHVLRADGPLARFTAATGQLEAAVDEPPPADGAMKLGFRPEDAALEPLGDDRLGIAATVVACHYLGHARQYALDAGGSTVQVVAPKDVNHQPGDRVRIAVAPRACLLFPED
jgi:iron(III) transport system ATP-binding protein